MCCNIFHYFNIAIPQFQDQVSTCTLCLIHCGGREGLAPGFQFDECSPNQSFDTVASLKFS